MKEGTKNLLNGKNGLSSDMIKIIAIIAMSIDHTAWIFFPGFSGEVPAVIMHIIGRLTAPIMLFFVAEGYYHTSNIKKYIFRLFVFAIISHFAFMFAFTYDKHLTFSSFIPLKEHYFEFDQTSIIWTLMLGLISLAIYKNKTLFVKNRKKYILIFIIILAAFPADWSSAGALAILFMGINHGNFRKQMLSLVLCIAVYAVMYSIMRNNFENGGMYGSIQMMIILAIPILYQYNVRIGNSKILKWLFYIYYPLHLTVLGFIRWFLLNK